MYRALHVVLGLSSKVSSEWFEDGKGRIDFRLADIGWGIEMMREGNRLNEHCGRFVGNGRYTPWTQIREWIIIDCRTSMPRPTVSLPLLASAYTANSGVLDVPGTKLWRAVFKSDFTSVEILDSTNQVLSNFPLTS